MDNSFFISQHAEQIIYGLILILMVSILVNLYFANNSLNKKLKDRSIKRQLPDLISTFLLGQIQKTEDAPRHNERRHLSKSVIALRMAYLKIEARAINHQIDSQAYWNLINHNVQKLLRTIAEKKSISPLQEIESKISKIREKISASEHISKSENVLKSLDNFQLACVEHVDNPEKLAHYNDKLAKLLDKLDNVVLRKLAEKSRINKTYAESNQKTLNTMSSYIEHSSVVANDLMKINPDDFNFPLDEFNQNQNEIVQSMGKYRQNIERLNSSNAATKSAIITSSENKIMRVHSELDDISEQIQRENELEIERLRKIIKNQKSIILDLEDSISRIEESKGKEIKAPVNDSEKLPQRSPSESAESIDINRLKSSLRDAELCIDTLEGELNSLKAQHISQLEARDNDSPFQPLSDNELAALEKTIVTLKNEISEAQESKALRDSIMAFISGCLDANSVEDLSLYVFQTLIDLGWSSALFINGGSRTLEVNPSGLLTEPEKILIKNMQVNEVDSQKSGTEIRFHYLNISGKIVATDSAFAAPDKHNSILQLLKTTDKIIGRIKTEHAHRKQNKAVQDCTNNIKKLAHEIDTTIDTIHRRNIDCVSNSFGQIQDIARSKGFKASQIASFRNLEQQTINELTADSSLRLKVKKQFLLILKTLENQ